MSRRCSLDADQKDTIIKLAREKAVDPYRRGGVKWFYRYLVDELGMIGVNFERLVFFLRMKIKRKETRSDEHDRGKHPAQRVVFVLMRRRFKRFGVK